MGRKLFEGDGLVGIPSVRKKGYRRGGSELFKVRY